MSTTAPDLEQECRQSRAKSMRVCVWKYYWIESYLTPSCCETNPNPPSYKDLRPHYRTHVVDAEWTYCPFCGKRIRVEK